LYETNNSITKDIFIYDDAAKPIYPYNFSIVNKQNIKLVASTANPFAASSKYNVEIDTTELFNSSLKVSGSVTTTGGVLEFTPGITFIDSTVYYWRVAQIPAQGEPKWSSFSFIYLANSDAGFNQSHFFQHLKSTTQDIDLDSNSRSWKFGTSVQNLFIRHGSWVTSAGQEGNFAITDANHSDIHNTCWFQSVVFNVYDPKTFKPWVNTTLDHVAPTGHGLYGSTSNDCSGGRLNNFEYRWDSATSRKRAMDFMQNVIPDGSYVVVRSFLLDPIKFPQYASLLKYVSEWHDDQGIYGAGQSLDQYLKDAGFADIDSFYAPRNFVFVYKKNDPSFAPRWVLTQGTYDNISLSVDCPITDSMGFITDRKSVV